MSCLISKIQFIILSLLLLTPCSVYAQGVHYTIEDSIMVEQLLSDAKLHCLDKHYPLYFAHRFKGIPYVGGTLDRFDTERLVVNIRELDCTTFVENVLALTLAMQSEHPSFNEFCQQLKRVRYHNGTLNGYASRNHYFSEWIENAERCGLVNDVLKDDESQIPLQSQYLLLDFMSTHANAYPMLKANPSVVASIRKKEIAMNGKEIRYIPKSAFDADTCFNGIIKSGDILAFVTKTKGLDIAHVGMAVWKEGRLLLLHASSKHKKVLLDTQTLHHYLRKSPLLLGVRVLRIL